MKPGLIHKINESTVVASALRHRVVTW